MSALDRTLRPVSYRLFGKVVAGFQRGSKDLGWPTANLDPSAFESQLNDSTAEGVYIGWAAVSDAGLSSASQQVHKAVLSIGWNPFYKNEKRTVEAYICHKYERDFYGADMKLLICGFMRPQADFAGKFDELIAAITTDVEVGKAALEQPPYSAFAADRFFAPAPP